MTVPCSMFVLVLLVLFGPAYGQTGSLVSPQSPAAAVLSIPGEALIPAALGVRTDRFGHSWNLDRTGSMGRVGSTMVNSGLTLAINQQKFETFQPRMTKDGREFVIHGRNLPGLSGIQIKRRVRFLDDIGALRYLEMFFNSSPNPVTLSIELATSFSGNYKSTVTDRGKIEPVLLSEGETGLVVTPGSSESNRAFLFVLCGPDVEAKPTISAQSRYGLRFQYQITLNPGETKGIAHIVTQTIVPRELDRKSLTKLFSPYSLAKIKRTIPDQFQDVIVNDDIKQSRSGLLLSGDTVDSLGVERLDTDVLAMGDQTRLFGKATIEPIQLETLFGKAEIPVESIAAIVGKNRGLRDQIRVFLHDGQVLSGDVPKGEINFDMKGGGRMKLSMDKLDRLVMARRGTELKAGTAMIQTWAGDQLKLESDDQLHFMGLTPWGDLSFTLADLIWLAPAPDHLPGYQVRLKNGTDCLIYLSDRELILNSGYFGDLTLNFSHVRALIPNKPGRISRGVNGIRLRGDQEVVGTLSDEEIQIVSNGQAIGLNPGEIRRFTNLQPSGSSDPLNQSFLVEMWDGSRIQGIVRAGELGVQVQAQDWQIPLTDIVELETSGPSLNNENRAKIANLVVQLGDPAWATREKATRDLEKFGYMAIPMLKGELNQNPDPEVRRRLERVLASFKE